MTTKPKTKRKAARKPRKKSAAQVKETRGRKTTFTREKADFILAHLKSGLSLRAICRMEEVIPTGASTVIDWKDQDIDGFLAQYTQAREIGFHMMAEEVLDIADDSTGDYYTDEDGIRRVDKEHLGRSRLKVDVRRWFVSKCLPKIYGDKLAHTGDDGGPIEVTWAQPKAEK